MHASAWLLETVGGIVLTQTTGTTPIAARAVSESSGRSILQYVTAGGLVGYVIITLSVVALGLVIAHFIQVRREKMIPPQAAEDLARLFRENDIASAFQYCAQEANDSFLTRVFHNALRRCGTSPFGMLELRAALEDAGQRETERLQRTTDAVGLIAAVGPMLGLLGTVFGMIGAFGAIGENDGAARSKELAGFMALALVTTAQGLVVAIPCTAAFQIFKRRIDRLASEAGEVIEQLAGVVEQASGAAKPQQRPRLQGSGMSQQTGIPTGQQASQQASTQNAGRQ